LLLVLDTEKALACDSVETAASGDEDEFRNER